MSRGIFISFEGIDGCGKTTQIELLTVYLLKNNKEVVLTREPGGCEIAESIREMILSTESKLGDRGELMLYLAARAEHVDQIIEPALRSDKWVISDRFSDATFAYQGYGRGLDSSMITTLNNVATNGLIPDITILLDIDVDEAYGRRDLRGKPDRLEQSGRDFFERTREGYLALAKAEPTRFIVVDASQSISNVTQTIFSALKEKLQNELT